jgi:hypothetical protein
VDTRPPFLVLPAVAEHGDDTCNVGRPITELQADFPALWNELSQLPDWWWSAELGGAITHAAVGGKPVTDAGKHEHDKLRRQQWQLLERRATAAVATILARPESVIAVVSHGQFLRYLLGHGINGRSVGNFQQHNHYQSQPQPSFPNCGLRMIEVQLQPSTVTSTATSTILLQLGRSSGLHSAYPVPSLFTWAPHSTRARTVSTTPTESLVATKGAAKAGVQVQGRLAFVLPAAAGSSGV